MIDEAGLFGLLSPVIALAQSGALHGLSAERTEGARKRAEAAAGFKQTRWRCCRWRCWTPPKKPPAPPKSLIRLDELAAHRKLLPVGGRRRGALRLAWRAGLVGLLGPRRERAGRTNGGHGKPQSERHRTSARNDRPEDELRPRGISLLNATQSGSSQRTAR